MPMRRYLPANILSCLLWAMIYSTVEMVGFRLLGWSWDKSPALTITTAVAIAGLIYLFVRKNRKVAEQEHLAQN